MLLSGGSRCVKNARAGGRLLAAAIALTSITAALGSADTGIRYGYRWPITEVGRQAVAPPWTLVWSRSPIWFERWNAGGLSESPNRRLARHGGILLTVMRRALYLLDKANGGTVASLPLEGDEIFDWTVVDGFFVYAAGDGASRVPIVGAINLSERKVVWTRKGGRRIQRPVWVLPVDTRTVIVGTDDDDQSAENEIAAVDVRTGSVKWTGSKDLEFNALIRYTWFVDGRYLSVLYSPRRDDGLYMRRLNLADGRVTPPVHVFGNDRIGNLFIPHAVTEDGRILIGYSDRGRIPQFALIAFSLREQRGLWNVPVRVAEDPLYFNSVAIGRETEPIVATMWPNTTVVADSATGRILRSATVSAYAGWTPLNAILYSYPYLFTSARRALDKGMAYDLIAINLETMKVDWSYEISRQDRMSLTADAEILNFIVEGDIVYVGRADARVMAFRTRAKDR